MALMSPVIPITLFGFMTIEGGVQAPYFAPLLLGAFVSPWLGIAGVKMTKSLIQRQISKGLVAMSFTGLLLVVVRFVNG